MHNNTLLQPLIDLANTNPQIVVLQKHNKKITAGELLKNSKALAGNLHEKKFKQGDVALLAVIPGQDFLIIFYALIILKARIAIIDNEMGKENYEAKMKQLKPQWLFADSRLLLLSRFPVLRPVAERFKKNLPQLYINSPLQIISAGNFLPFYKCGYELKKLLVPLDNMEILTANEEPYENIIIYTSGTLSIPKAVVHTDVSLHSTLKALEKIFYNDKNIILATYLPHFMLLGIACGFSVKIIGAALSPGKKLKWFYKEKITVYFGAPYDYLPLIIYCEKNKILFPHTLEHLIVGSAPVHKSFLKRLVSVLHTHTKITCTYGMTEHLITALADGREKILYEGKGDLLGTVAKGVSIKIAEDGEIFVRSTQLFKRYLFQQKGNLWHGSGDLGQLDGQGNLVLLGRKKDMIIRRNFNIYPALYEDTIKKISGITEAVLVGIYDDQAFDEKVYLVIETELKNIDEISKKIKTGAFSIDKEAQPDVIIKMEIPRCGRHQKIDRIAIVKILKNKF